MIIRIVVLFVLILLNTGILSGKQNHNIVEESVSSTSLENRDVTDAIMDELGRDSLLIKDVDAAFSILVANGTIDRIYKKRLNSCGFDDADHIILILFMCLLVVIFSILLYRYKKWLKNNIDLSKNFLLEYANMINNAGNSCIDMLLVNTKTDKIYVFKENNYEEFVGGSDLALNSIHPEDRDSYVKQRNDFLKSRKPSMMMYIRLFDERSNKYNLNEIVFNILERNLLGKVLKYHVIAHNKTFQNEVFQQKYRDLQDLNMAVQSARLIRWDIDLLTNINRFVNVDNKVYVYTNRQIFRQIIPDDYKQLHSLIDQVKREKCIDSISVEIDLFGDGYKSYEVMATLVCDEYGNPSHIYGILKDISKLQHYQKLLSREVDVNRTIWMSANTGVFFYDATGLCKDVNHKVLSLFDISKDKLVDHLNLLSLNHISEVCKDKLRRGEAISYKMSYKDVRDIICKDKTIVENENDELFSVECSPVFNEERKLIGYVSVYTDITEITRSRIEVEELDKKIVLALDTGNLVVWTYNLMEDNYTVLAQDQFSAVHKAKTEFVNSVLKSNKKIIDEAYEAIITRKSQKEIFILRTIIDGKTVTIRSSIAPHESEGEVLHIIGVSKDITEETTIKSDLAEANAMLDKKNQELNLSNQLFVEIIEQMPGLLFIKNIDDDYKYDIANSHFCNVIAGKSLDEVVGYSDYDIFPKEIADRFRIGDLKSIEKNESLEFDEEIIKDGRTSMWKTVKTPVTLANNKKMLICLSMDITEIYHMKNEAQRLDALKSQFLANVSHELRTPLNAIVGFSNLLLDTDDYETKLEFNEIISANSDLLLNLINDILDLSKIESGVVSFVDEYFNVNEFLDDTYLSFNMRMRPDVTLRYVKLDDDWDIMLDNKRFSQVLNNFLSNAVKYTPSGEITFGCVMERGGIRLYVKDTGIGISEQNKVKVFHRFEKLDTFAQGTGLGLSICKAIVDLKNGDIGFESTLGEGSYFWIWIPCEKRIK